MTKNAVRQPKLSATSCETRNDRPTPNEKLDVYSVIARDESPGAKFAAMDLIGLPWQLVVGPRGVTAGTVEFKNRKTGERDEISAEAALARLTVPH